MDTKLSTLLAQRNFLEGQLLWLEQEMDTCKCVLSVGSAREAQTAATDSAADVAWLLVLLANVNAELAAMRGMPGQA